MAPSSQAHCSAQPNNSLLLARLACERAKVPWRPSYARVDRPLMAIQDSMSRLEAIAVDDWPGVDISVPVLAEDRIEGPA
jgi:hypothetical protein